MNSELANQIEEVRKDKTRIKEKIEKIEEENKKIERDLKEVIEKNKEATEKIKFQELQKTKEITEFQKISVDINIFKSSKHNISFITPNVRCFLKSIT